MTRINDNDKIPKCQGGNMLKQKFNERIVLIESDYFEYLTTENNNIIWKKIKIEGLPFIPVIITTNAYKKENKIIYNIYYELPYTHEDIMTSSNETFITEKDNEGKSLLTTQIKMPNKEYDNNINTPIRLDNQNIDIIKRVKKNNDIQLEYISKKRKQISKLNQLLDKSASLIINKKILKK